MLEIFQSPSAAERVDAARAFIAHFPSATEIVLVGASRDAADDLARQIRAEGLKAEVDLAMGHPGDQICNRARDQRADLIVTSTHGRTGLKHILIGSTAEFVVRHAPCPVVVVPTFERPQLRGRK